LPGGQSEGFAFDLGGTLVCQTNYNGMVITNQYDELNRLTNQISVNGYQVSYAYDPATGQRVRMTDGSGVAAYGYDRRDRLVSKTVNWNHGPGVSLNYGYDANGNVTNLWSGTAGGVNLAYRCDPMNRLADVTQDTLDGVIHAATTTTKFDLEQFRIKEFFLAHQIIHESHRWLLLASDPCRHQVSFSRSASSSKRPTS
jgi:YD repeat-containing protein